MNAPGNGPASRRCKRSTELQTHSKLVRQIAGRMRARLPSHVEMNDLLQAGLIGLNEALSRFEQGRGSSFEAYAARRIEGAMLDALRANDTIPRGTRARLRKAHAAAQKLEHQLGRAPRAKEVSNELGWTLDEFHALMVEAGAGGARADDTALEGLEGDAWNAAEVNDASIDDRSDPLQTVQTRQRHAALNAAFDALEEIERYVMEQIYDHDATLRDIGDKLGVSESRVSQINAQIVAKLKLRLRDW